MTFRRFNNTFVVMCIDDLSTIKFFNIVSVVKHASFLRMFNLSDTQICFLKIDKFFDHLNHFLMHLKNLSIDGQNALLLYVFNGIFINLYNINLIENLLSKYKYFLDIENLFIQTIVINIILLESLFINLIDSFLLLIENKFFYL